VNLRSAQPRERTPALDLISMVDLVFLLIIFFLTTSTFIEKNKAKVDLPDEPGESYQEIRRSSLIVNLTRNGSYIVAGETLTLDEITARVAGEIALLGGDPARLDLVLRADHSAAAAALNDLAQRLVALEVRAWKLATETPPGAVPPPLSGGRP